MFAAFHGQHSAACGLDWCNAEPLVGSLVALNQVGRARPRGHMDDDANEPRKSLPFMGIGSSARQHREKKSGHEFFSLAKTPAISTNAIAFGHYEFADECRLDVVCFLIGTSREAEPSAHFTRRGGGGELVDRGALPRRH